MLEPPRQRGNVSPRTRVGLIALAAVVVAAGLANAAWQTWRAHTSQRSCLAIDPDCFGTREPTTSVPSPTGSTVVDEGASFFLTVSNQSFAEPTVRIEVRVDGQPSIEGVFAVEGQHNFVGFALDLAPGEHTLTASVERGPEQVATFVLPEDEPRYGVLLYWGADEATPFTWQFQTDPPAFG